MKFPAALLFLTTAALAKDFSLLDRKFVVADGYELTVAVPPTLVARPMEADFDTAGHLFVTESSGSNEAVAEQVKKRPHQVWRLADTDKDGVYDTKTAFVKNIMFPEGILCHEGSVYVSAAPKILKFTDTNNDGEADKEEVWFDGKTLTFCANDLHGPYLGPDGLLYWCKGAFGEQTYDLPGHKGWKSRASHIFRMKPDGTEFDVVFTAGMDNPVGVAWTPEGELMVCGTFLQHPADGKRDGIIHAVQGGVWGKEHDVVVGHPYTGGLMPPMTHLGPGAPAGMCRYGRDLLVCQFNTHKLSLHTLTPQGGSYRTEDTDVVSCEHPDFHPTDVLQDADGSVLLVDTGGWYKLCCPTSQLAKPDVPGGIYRLRKTGGEVPRSCPEAKFALSPGTELAEAKSPNTVLRRLAIEKLAKRLQTASEADCKPILTLLAEAAELPDTDRFLEHAVCHAFLQCGHPQLLSGLITHGKQPRARRLALIALAQKSGDHLDGPAFEKLLALPDEPTFKAVSFALYCKENWQQAAKQWLTPQNLAAWPAEFRTMAVQQLAKEHPALLPDLGSLLTDATDASLQATLLAAMQAKAAKDTQWPEAWATQAARLVQLGNVAAADFLGTAKFSGQALFLKEFTSTLQNTEPSLRLRLMANPSLAEGSAANVAFCREIRKTSTNLPDRLAATRLLGKWSLPANVLRELASEIGSSSALERPMLLAAFRESSDADLGSYLVSQLRESGALNGLSEQVLADATAKFPDSVRNALAAARIAAKQGGAEQQKQLLELEAKLPPGDAQRGALVFHSSKVMCSLCHKIGYKGGELGPELGKIGSIRTRKDLLEAIVYPSASFVRSYEPMLIEKHSGEVAYGNIQNQGAESLTLVSAPGVPSTRLALKDIKSMKTGEASLMPMGLDKVMTPEELGDLLAFLQSLK
jgi:putative membrane-bound dehydrogenase-like protein